MNSLLAKLGQDPKRSLSIFLRGFALFTLGIIFISIGYYHHHLWQVLGIFILAIACLTSLWGYLGIFANRWYNILNKKPPNNNKKD